ncbi:hypothetical protein C4588_01080 [Candidatus Parcubacteria bacterium]|nr:MAG: hypothetical protein C4588_01080 [Candidatus Parcubacteria bacterium]
MPRNVDPLVHITVDIRGTNGSGKTTVVRRFLQNKTIEIVEGDTFVKDFHIWTVGRYDRAECGGADGVQPIDEIEQRVKSYNRCIVEGVIVSHSFARWYEVARSKRNYFFVFLDTPLDICVERVKKRREAKGNTRPLNTKWLVKDYYQIQRVREKLLERDYPHVLDRSSDFDLEEWLNLEDYNF